VIAALAVSSSARADPPDDNRVLRAEEDALAEELFREGKRLVAEGDYEAACPKLAESYRLDPGGGTLLALALCHEAAGRTASAWADFTAAITLAKRDHRADREQIAREHAEALVPRLRRIRVRVASPGERGLSVLRDGALLGPAAWSVAAPVDPGDHVVEASAPGRVTFRIVVTAERDGESIDVDVPQLAAIDERPLEAQPRSVPPLRWASYASAGLGIVALSAGVFLGLDARSKRDDANSRCQGSACSDPVAVDLSRRAGERADLSTASFIAAGTFVATGVVLFLVSGERRATLRF
jgi:hypothetical protein